MFRSGATPDHAGRIGVRRQELAKRVSPLEGSPDLRPPEEDPLIAGEAFDHGRGLSVRDRL